MIWTVLCVWAGFGLLCWGVLFWLNWKYKDQSFGGIRALPAWLICGPLMLVFVFGYAVGVETERRKHGGEMEKLDG